MEKKKIILPNPGKLVSEFAREVSQEIKDKHNLFFRIDSREIVEVRKIILKKDSPEQYLGFSKMGPYRLITFLEDYIIPCELRIIHGVSHLLNESIGPTLATTLIESDILQTALPPINRIFTIPIPIIYEGKITFPKKGYDSRFQSWLPFDAPEISNPDMDLETAKKTINLIFREFCFATDQDRVIAISALLTPFLRGLFPEFNTRTPVFFYLGNRERCGKDYCAGVSGILYEGQALEEPPLSTSEDRGNNSEELRKKLLSALRHGRKRLHFSNNRGHIDNAVFEGIITAKTWSDRILGKSENLTFSNELDFSLSGNMGVTFTPDLVNRCRIVRLFLDIEDANSRSFSNPDLHNFILKNRDLFLSALYALVRNWVEAGRPSGSTPFTSFPEWATVCGGIMESAGLGNPCLPDKETSTLGMDAETQDMKILFEECFQEQLKDKSEFKLPLTFQSMKVIAQKENLDIFGYLDFSNKSDQIKFGNKILKFSGRILSNIKMVCIDSSARPSRREYIFEKV